MPMQYATILKAVKLIICLQSFTYVVSVRRGFPFLFEPGVGCVILLWYSLCLPCNYFKIKIVIFFLIFAQTIDRGYLLEPPR